MPNDEFRRDPGPGKAIEVSQEKEAKHMKNSEIITAAKALID